MAMAYMKIFVDTLDMIGQLNYEERGRLFTALLEYVRTGETLPLEGNERFIFPALKLQLDREAASYEKLCEVNRANASGRKRSLPIATESLQDKDKEEEKDEEKEKEKDSSYSGAYRPARRKNTFSKGRAPVPRADSPETVRKDLKRMEQYLQKLQEGNGAPS